MRDLNYLREELGVNRSLYEEHQSKIQESKSVVSEFENRLRYANDIIMQLETENQQVLIDLSQAKAAVEGQNRAYQELKGSYYLAAN